MRFLLDSNAVIALLNDPAGHVSRRVRQYQPADIGLSAIVMHELYFGAFKSQRRDRNMAIVDGYASRSFPSTQRTRGTPGIYAPHLLRKARRLVAMTFVSPWGRVSCKISARAGTMR